MRPTQNPELQKLEALVGEWTTEATHPAYPDTVVHGEPRSSGWKASSS